MAATTIKDAYDLAGGAVDSDVVASPTDLSIGWKVSGTTDTSKKVKLEFKRQVGSEDYHVLKDEYRRPIFHYAKGNVSDSINLSGVNATNFKVTITPDTGHDGTISVYSL